VTNLKLTNLSLYNIKKQTKKNKEGMSQKYKEFSEDEFAFSISLSAVFVQNKKLMCLQKSKTFTP